MRTMYAVLLDVTGIQRYVFESSRLKGNIGASFLVEEVYRDLLQEALQETVGHAVSLDDWKTGGDARIYKDSAIDVEVASIGGGSALILFRDDKGKKFVSRWTEKLLLQAPGLRTAVALGSLEEGDRFSAGVNKLYETLQSNKNSIFPEVELPRHGITQDCLLSGGGAEVLYKDADGESKHISAAMQAKMEAALRGNRHLQKLFAEELGEKYAFTDQLDQLGQVTGKNYIALVHIDGNNMGELFRKCGKPEERRRLSLQVAQGAEQAFRSLLKDIVSEYEAYSEKDGILEFAPSHAGGKEVLPIRPIILGGDDITFVSHGQLGLLYAERYMRHLLKHLLTEKELPFHSCAGVAIIKTSYPFFRGYRLAEALCASAKKKAREQGGGSWLDFYTVHGEVSGGLEAMKREEYQGVRGNLHFGPYCLNSSREASFEELLQGISFFQNGAGGKSDKSAPWPRNKVKELRGFLKGTEHDMALFLRDRKLQGCMLPALENLSVYAKSGWSEQRTPYFDMIELLEFMPSMALKGREKA